MAVAPVMGGTYGAEDATITITVACDEKHRLLPVVKPILITMGTKILSCGAPTFVVVAEITNKYQVGIHASGNEYRNSSGRDPHILQKVIAV